MAPSFISSTSGANVVLEAMVCTVPDQGMATGASGLTPVAESDTHVELTHARIPTEAPTANAGMAVVKLAVPLAAVVPEPLDSVAPLAVFTAQIYAALASGTPFSTAVMVNG